MPKLSLWRTQKGNDYRFFDRNISEQMTVGATDFYVYKYLGVANQGPSTDPTQPQYQVPQATQIQDLVFLENRDRVYSDNIYRLRGHYNVQNLDFNLSQFGLFLNNDTIFITFHFNDMIDILGRKLMVGDVFELPHLTDYNPLNETLPVSLRRYYQVTDANYASEGFSPTWFYHLWRVKAEPLIDSEEFANVLNRPTNSDTYLGNWDPAMEYPPGYTITYGDKVWINPGPGSIPAGVTPGTNPGNPWQLDPSESLKDVLSTYNTNIAINDAVIAEAALLVPKTGYDRTQLYLVPTLIDDQPAPPVDLIYYGPGPITIPSGVVTVSTALGNRPAIKIKASDIANLEVMLKDSGVKNPLTLYSTISLHGATTAPQAWTDDGSGPVSGRNILFASAVGPITGPYGTADNTYATSDAFLSWTVTAQETAIYSTTITTITGVNNPITNKDMVPGLLVSAVAPIAAGGTIPIFPPGTRIATVIDEYTFTVTNPTMNFMPASTVITVNPDFTGTVSSEMDWRADCVPGFQFIKRGTPRQFGYIDGYMTGQDSFPNQLPYGSGITFPGNPQVGDYFLRTDYLPQQLFRWDGALWIKISENVRTGFGFGELAGNQSQQASFINNTNQTVTQTGTIVPERQSLSQALKITPD